MSSASWTWGSKASVGLDLDEALLPQRIAERLLDELHAFDELCVLVSLGGPERPLEVVEDGQELADEPLVRVRNEPLLLASGTLSVVLEVGLTHAGRARGTDRARR